MPLRGGNPAARAQNGRVCTMKSTYLSFAVLSIVASAVFAQSAPDGSSPAAQRQAWLEAEAAQGVTVSGHEDWRAWLKKNFPDASRSWPAACARSFSAAAGATRWTLVHKADVDRDGRPTALLIRARRPGPGANEKSPDVVEALKVVECSGGSWKEVFGLEGRYQVMMSYDAPPDPLSPGMTISVSELDEAGRASDSEDYSYLPGLGKYGGEADKEALKEGRPGRRTARKKKPR